MITDEAGHSKGFAFVEFEDEVGSFSYANTYPDNAFRLQRRRPYKPTITISRTDAWLSPCLIAGFVLADRMSFS